jgi:hypothetical protein
MTEEVTQSNTEDDAALGRFEKYLQHDPLNEELAAVQRGELPPVQDAELPQQAEAAVQRPEALRGALTRAERVALRELRQSEGYAILQELLRKRFQQIEKGAITISKVDPLQNKDEIAKQWVYLGAFAQAMLEIDALMAAELKILWEQEQ